MQGRSGFSRSGNFKPESLGQDALKLIGNLCFAIFVLGVVVFTIIAATYQPDDPLLHPSSKITTFLTSTSNATFRSDGSAVKTGEDFISPNNQSVAADTFIKLADIVTTLTNGDGNIKSGTGEEAKVEDDGVKTDGGGGDQAQCDVNKPIDCSVQDIFHLMMKSAIETFKDIHFYRFGKPAHGDNDTSCDIAWRFRPKDAKRAGFYKDYRRFVITQNADCSYTVVSIGDYHSGVNARKKKKRNKGGKGNGDADSGGFALTNANPENTTPVVVPVVGEVVNDSLPVVESEGKFSSGKYLLYTGGGERCKSMDHYMWSFLCALGEAQYLNRTLVMDLSICLSSMYTSTNQHEEGKDFRLYFDFEHLKESASVLDQRQFWTDWGMWQKKDGLKLHLIEDFRVTPMKIANIKDSLIMRKFGSVEPDNYWYRVCEGETESVVQRPWHLLWKSRRLLEIVSGIATRMNWDFDSVHIVRGEKAKNTELWPNLAADTSPEALLSTLRDKIDDGRNLFIFTDEPDTSYFDPLKDKYTIHFLDDFKDMWGENSEWYAETKQLNNGIPVDFDGYMRIEVSTEVFLRGKKQLETFNDLTNDCKDGINTCKASS